MKCVTYWFNMAALVCVLTVLLFLLKDVYGDQCIDLTCDECCGTNDDQYCCYTPNIPLIVGLCFLGLVVLILKALCIWACLRSAGINRRVVGYARINTTTPTASSNQAGAVQQPPGSGTQVYPPLLAESGTSTIVPIGYQPTRPPPARLETNPPPPGIYKALNR